MAGAEVSLPRVGVAIGLCVFGSIAIKQIPGHDILAVHWTSDGVPAMPMFGPATGVVSWYAETALALPLLLTAVLVITRTRVNTILSVAGQVRWAWLGACSLAACVALAVGGACALLLRPDGYVVALGSTLTTGKIITALALIALAGVCAVTQELLFRGWYLQTLGAEQTALAAIMLQAFVSMGVHPPGVTVWGYTDLALYAVVAGWLAISTGGIEAAIALPIAWNAGLVAVAVLTTGNPDPTRGMIPVSWQALVVHLTAIVTYAAVTRLVAHYRSVAVTVAGSAHAPQMSRTEKELAP
jgi:CAAX protease family protein